MIIRVANPIYDSVFKYMMEDERIARTILSALLKKEVVEVQIRRNEYTTAYVTTYPCSASTSGHVSVRMTARCV